MNKFLHHKQRIGSVNKILFEKNFSFFIFCLVCLLPRESVSEASIIQEELMSFEKCLKVIEMSEENLLITPKISMPNEQEKIATFTLSDGTLSITCNKNKNLMTVSTDQ